MIIKRILFWFCAYVLMGAMAVQLLVYAFSRRPKRPSGVREVRRVTPAEAEKLLGEVGQGWALAPESNYRDVGSSSGMVWLERHVNPNTGAE